MASSLQQGTGQQGPLQQGTRRWWALIAIAVSALAVGLDMTVLNLALPTLSRDLHASTGDLQWFGSAYTLVVAAVLLPVGLTGDSFGRKKILLIALTVFGAGSAACAYAGSSGQLIAARAFLGLGAAAILPLSLSVLPVFFTEKERPKAIAIVMGAVFLGYPVGPLLGGFLLDRFWWGSVFLINVPVVVIALAVVAALLPESRSDQRPRLDLAGVLISSAGLTALTYGFIKEGQNGWGDTAAVATIGAGAVILAAFAGWERYAARRGTGQPLVELGLFRSAGFTWGTLLTTLVSFALFGILWGMPQYFQDVRGTDALGSGLRLLPMIGGLVAGMLAGTRLQSPPRRRRATARAAGGAGTADGRGGARTAGGRGGAGSADGRAAAGSADGRAPAAPVSAKALVTAGFAVMAAGLAAGAFTRAGSGAGFTAAWFAAAGTGLGLAMPSAMNAALAALSAGRSGAGSALITASGVGAGIEAAGKLGSPQLLDAVRTAYVHGLDLMLWVCAGIAAACALLALAFLPGASGQPPETDAGAVPSPEAQWDRGADIRG